MKVDPCYTHASAADIAYGLADTFHTFVFERQDDFKEIDDFVEDTNRQYSLGMRRLNIDFRNGVKSLVSETSMKAIILGTRRQVTSSPGMQLCKAFQTFLRFHGPHAAAKPERSSCSKCSSGAAQGGPQC